MLTIYLFKRRNGEGSEPSYSEISPQLPQPTSDMVDTHSLNYLNQQEDRSPVYDEIASKYDGLTSMDELVMGMPLLRRWLIKKYAKGDVLELSSGTGRNLKYYRSTFGARHPISSLTLVEKSKNMVDVALQACTTCGLVDEFKRRRKRIRFYQLDAHSLAEFGDNTFDTVVDTFGLCSYRDPVKVLNEMQRVCKPDGKILLLQHGLSDYQFINDKLHTTANQRAMKWGCWWNRDIAALLEASKLKVTYLNRWHFGTTFYVVASPNKAL